MAARSDAATDHVTIAAAPDITAFTICAWVKLASAAAGSFNPMMRVDAGGGTGLIVGFKGTNGRTPSIYSGATPGGVLGTEVALGTYVFVAAVRSGTTATLYQGTTPGSLTKVSGTVNSNGTPDGLGIFGRAAGDNSEWLDGTMAYFRIWTAVLSDAEIAVESQSTTPARTAGLWSDWPFAAAALTDSSGNGRTLTAGTTALAADTDPPLGPAPITGGGAATAPAAAAAGTGAVRISASGTASAQPATVAGAGSLPVGGTGTAVAVPAVAGGDGAVPISGAGAAVAPAAIATGTGGAEQPITGSGTAVAPAAVAAGLGSVVITGQGTAVAPAAVAHGSAGGVVHAAAEPRLTILPNLATLTIQPAGGTLTIDQGDTA